MFQTLNKEQFLELAKRERRIVVYKEVPADLLTPAGVFQAVARAGVGSALLESAERPGQYSFIGVEPYAIFQSKEESAGKLREAVHAFSAKNPMEAYPFIGGGIGFMSYDAIRLFEKIPDRHGENDIPDFFLHFYEKIIAFDHARKRALFAVVSAVGREPEKDYQEAMEKIDALIAKAHHLKEEGSSRARRVDEKVEVDCDDETFKKMVEKGKEYIAKGDVFQVVLSRTFTKKYHVTPFQIYRALRLTSPSPYMFYFDAGEFQIAGASPEMLVQVKQDVITTTPIAGTRPRGKTPEEDSRMEKELIHDVKENAEHVMLVDLGRNDIGSVAKIGSVQVKDFKTVQKFSHVMHIVSEVIGIKKESCDVVDVLKANFPAGTLSGAPKIRAMQIIDELETSKRGIYGGGILALDAHGNLISCIAIRMAVLHKGVARVRAGAGIVYDSDPQKEADETRHKAKNVLDAISLAEVSL